MRSSEANSRQLPLPLSSPASGNPEGAPSPAAADVPATSRLVASLAAFCREHPLDEKILVAPDRIVGRQITDAVARLLSPGGWVNLHVETVGSLAHAIAGPEIAAERRTSLSRAQRVAIVEKICAEALDDGAYFGALRRSAGFHRVLSRTIDELRSSGIDPAILRKGPLENGRKASELAALLAAYDAELGARFADAAGVLRRAIALAEGGAPPSRPWVIRLDRPALSGAEEDLLRRFAGDRLVVAATDDPDERPRADAFHFRRAVGEENELREVFRRALAESIPWDRIEILYTDRSTYLSLAYELSRQYDVPATFVDRIDVAYTRPGRAAIAFLDWLSADFGERELRSLLTAGALDLRKLSGSASLTAAGAARILREAKIGWGSERYLACLGALEETRRYGGGAAGAREADPPEAEAAARRRRDLASVRLLARRLIAAAPVRSAEDTVTLEALAGACAGVVGDFARVASELDGAAKTAIASVLGDLGFLAVDPMPLRSAALRIREAIADLFVGGSAVTYPRPGMIHVAGYQDGGHTGRPYTFIVGLDESRHPGSGMQDPVLLDGERHRVNAAGVPAALALRGDAPRERGEALRATIARLRGDVTLSWSCHDLAEDREQFPAAALLDLFRRVNGDPAADSDALAAAAGPPAGYFPAAAPLDPSEWWLAALRRTGQPRSGRPPVLEAYPWLEAGDAARAARASDRFTAWDGAVAGAGTALDPRESGEVVSASRLQLLADCPFSYFLRYVLRIEPPEEVARDPGVWLGPPDLGKLLHEVFREFMEEEAGRERRRSGAEADRGLDAVADRAIERWRRTAPPPNEAALERQRRDIRRACATFLRSEEREAARIAPRHFEIGFGFDGAPPDPVLGDTGTVSIDLGRGVRVRVRGNIDRVDRAEDGSWEIWDYKTGSAFGYDPAKGMHGGRRIQPAFYSAAFEELLRRAGLEGEVSRAGYIFTGPRGDGRREDFGWSREAFRKTVRDLCDVLRSGAFLHAIDAKEGCAFCPYQTVCGGRGRAADAAARKLANARDGALAVFQALGWDAS